MLPGALYSLLLAIVIAAGEWTTAYFSGGDGSGFSWAPIVLAAVPVVLKAITVYLSPTEPEQPQAAVRGFGVEETQSSKVRKFWLG